VIVIVGAGPAGLSAAYHLQAECVILEKNREPGGLCRSFQLGGATFDYGGHAFFTRHEYVRTLIQETFQVPLFTQDRKAWVYASERYIPYPFQMHLHGLPPAVITECLVGLYQTSMQHTTVPPRNLQDWIDRSFGPGIARHFLTPYNRKLWAYPLEEISTDWTSERIVLPEIEAIIAGAIGTAHFKNFPNATVSYPACGGFIGLFEGLVHAVRDRLVQADVVSVDLKKQHVVTGDGGVIPYEFLISTMPLTQLVASLVEAPTCCVAAASELKFNSLYLVNLVFPRPPSTDMQRIYAADPSIPFHKLVLNSNSSDTLRELPVFGVQAEVSFSPCKEVEAESLVEEVLTSLVRMGIIAPGETPSASSLVRVEHAYPVRTSATEQARQHLLAELSSANVLCAGRFGEWLYINSDDAILRGLAQARSIGQHLQRRR
jgi:UDP-galactopyranose mutase